MPHRYLWIHRSSCFPRSPWSILTMPCGVLVWPMSTGLRRSWTIRSSTVLASCPLPPPLTVKVCSFFFPHPFQFVLFSFAFLYMVTFIWNTCIGMALPLAFLLILLICLGRSNTYGPDGFVRDHLVPCNTNVMGYPFYDGTRGVSSLPLLSLLLFLFHLSTAHSNMFSFKFQPIIQEH